MVKKRSPNQQLEQESRSKFAALLSEWIVNDLSNDFGFDFDVRITEKNRTNGNQKVTGHSFYVQLKSTESTDSYQYYDLDTQDIILFENNNIPVLLVQYNKNLNLFVYEIVQIYTWEVLENKNPEWKNQKYNRIHFTKSINDLSELQNEIITAQIKIIRRNNYNLGLGEGISFSHFDTLREIDLNEFKFKTLSKSFEAINNGNVEIGIRLLQEAYSIKRDDLLTLTTCFNLVIQLNPVNPQNQPLLAQYSSDGIKIAEKINLMGFTLFFKIEQCQLLLIQNITQLSQIFLTKKINETHNDSSILGYLIQEDSVVLYNEQQRIVTRIGYLLNELIKSKNHFELIFSLIILLECITYQTQRFGFIREDYVKIEVEHRKQLISDIEKLFAEISNKQLQLLAYSKLGDYYFWICNYSKAETYIRNAIDLAHEIGNMTAVNDLNSLLEEIIQQKNPYDKKNRTTEDEVLAKTLSEMKQYLIISAELQGFDLTKKGDPYVDTINVGLSDMDMTQYLKFCENVRIGFLSTSEFGQMIGIPSIGQKIVWCTHAKTSAQGFSLDTIFRGFKERNCVKCPYRQPRKDTWVCTYGHFIELTKDSEFSSFVKKLYEKK